MLLGFDPGRDKCGIAITPPNAPPLYHEIIPSAAAIAQLQTLLQTYPIAKIILGDQTSSKTWQKKFRDAFPMLEIVTVDERNSSLEARDRYWQMYPPTGLMRLVPPGMRQPPRPIDDIVAILLIERYLAQL
jgi:RNase H-fold protein (predicted Holliday junction resolvase)